MDVRINSYRPVTIASQKPVNKTQKVDPQKASEKKETAKTKIPEGKKEDQQQSIDTYAAYRKRKYAERIKTRFDLLL
jgi:hypothetical protein